MQPRPQAQVSASAHVKPHYAWQLWTHGPALYKLGRLTPLLASWNKKTDPEQIRLQVYLDQLEKTLAPIVVNRTKLSLHMEIDVVNPQHLLYNHDVENYLTPVVQRLGAAHFVLVSGIKRVGGGSQLTISVAQPLSSLAHMQAWGHFSCSPSNSYITPQWKQSLRNALARTHPSPLPPGPVEVQIAWKCGINRNWLNLWKPTADAMGPVLGEPDPKNPFNPADDRITSLALHLNTDPTLGYDVDVGMWWRPLSLSSVILGRI